MATEAGISQLTNQTSPFKAGVLEVEKKLEQKTKSEKVSACLSFVTHETANREIVKATLKANY